MAHPLTEHVLKGYLECALWLADEEPGVGEYHVTPDLITAQARATARPDVEAMVESAGVDFDTYLARRGGVLEQRTDEAVAEHFGHDFFLTRNGHGAGFWDRGLGELGDRLTALVKPYGEQSCFIGEEGLELL